LEESRSRENFPSDSSGQYWCHVLPCKLPLLVCVSSIYAFFFFLVNVKIWVITNSCLLMAVHVSIR
jgi:hypothetical protein